ncbi:hypothetical protein HNQ02_003276 [Flavobacterium sp. 7E]|uniref:hypothetical protein n=1 Tax=Flavobacterium sp. 7E TaxID=2735898 RepID=UPI0015704427|nr:hypothetical protein [Flavobacterium sp. 7E]NRS90336.1 hypothetical protein [Flavobacterium sp. 7E]
MNKRIAFLFLIGLISCSPKYIHLVKSDTKPKFGFEIPAPSKAVFFVENEKNSLDKNYINTANLLYNKYGPATDNFVIGLTDASDFIFKLGDKTYYIDVKKLPKSTAMLLFDGKHKPTVIFNPKRFEKFIIKKEKTN